MGECFVVDHGHTADGINETFDTGEVDQAKVIDLDSQEVLGDQRLVRNAANGERMVDLGLPISRQFGAGIARH